MFLRLLLLVGFSSCVHSTRFIGPEDAEEGFAPYQVWLRTPSNVRVCGGVIVNERFILTAAQCVKTYGDWKNLQVVTGTNDWRNPDEIYYIEKVIRHCNYNKALLQDDIALLRINETIIENDNTEAIKLAHNQAINGGDLVETIAWSGALNITISGFGTKNRTFSATEELQKLTQFVVPNYVCNKMLKQVNGSQINNEHICAVTGRGGSSCKADRGSPLIDTNGALIGIASTLGKENECANGYPDIYTSTIFHIDWINIKMKENYDDDEIEPFKAQID